MDNALTITTEQAIAQTSQSLQLQSIAHNTKRVYCHAAHALLELVRKIRVEPAEMHFRRHRPGN